MMMKPADEQDSLSGNRKSIRILFKSQIVLSMIVFGLSAWFIPELLRGVFAGIVIASVNLYTLIVYVLRFNFANKNKIFVKQVIVFYLRFIANIVLIVVSILIWKAAPLGIVLGYSVLFINLVVWAICSNFRQLTKGA